MIFSLNKLLFKALLFTTLLVALLVVFLVNHTGRSFALTGSNFQAGRIIDDAVFFNKNSMSANQIQAFLDSKVPSCDTNGEQPIYGTTRALYGASVGNPAPYTCVKDYTEPIPTITNGGSDLCAGNIAGAVKSAAQIIYDVSQACGISPQVIIVLLQKEQSLITDDWPWSIQYRSATGYGCPDTAPCDTEYYGFFNQVYQAAKAYRRYEANPNSYNYKANRNNTILYQANSPGCGSSTVFIENQATANLYIYTPYQPNQAALDNLYGSGDSCSAYGNRNFWRMFNDWFGPTLGSLVRTTSSASLYYSDGERRYAVPSMNIASEFGLGVNDVRFVSQQELDAIPLAGTPYSSILGTLVKSISDTDDDGSTVYLVSNGYKTTIPSIGILTNFGYSGTDVTYMSLENINRLLPSPKTLSNLIRGSNATIYDIEAGKKRIIFEYSKFVSLNVSDNVTTLSDFAISRFAYGIPQVDGDYVVSKGADIRVYNGANYFDVNNIHIYNCWALNNIKTFAVSDYIVSNGTKTGNLSCIAQNSSAEDFIVNGTNRLLMPPGHGLTPVLPGDTLVNTLPEKNITVVIRGTDATLSVFDSGTKRTIPNMTIFSQLGYTGNDISTIPGLVFSAIPEGPYKLSASTLVKGSNSSSVYVVNSDSSKYAISSISTFTSYGFSWSQVITVQQNSLDAYPTSGSLSKTVKEGVNVYIIDQENKYLVGVGLDSHLSINRASLQTVHSNLLEFSTQKSMTRFVKYGNSSTIYYLDSGQKRPISSWGTFLGLGGQGNLLDMSDSYINTFPTGPTI